MRKSLNKSTDDTLPYNIIVFFPTKNLIIQQFVESLKATGPCKSS